MTAPAPCPVPRQAPQPGAPVDAPKRSERMIFWLVVLPVVLLLLAFAGANWRWFHFAYCRHLLRTEDVASQGRALWLIERYGHLKPGTAREEVKRLLAPVTPVRVFKRAREQSGASAEIDKNEVVEVYRYDVRPRGSKGSHYYLDLEFCEGKLEAVRLSGGAF
jgi:hypothetical protein